MELPSYGDVTIQYTSSEHSKSLLLITCSKVSISLVFDESVTDGPTDEQTGYRDARTHLRKCTAQVELWSLLPPDTRSEKTQTCIGNAKIKKTKQ